MAYYNRYKRLSSDERIISPPFIKLTERSSDTFVQYDVKKSRLDKISQEYYGDPTYTWLILMANPEFGGLEWNIQNGEMIRIPQPLSDVLKEYELKLKERLSYYGE
jgi:hypothetical protein